LRRFGQGWRFRMESILLEVFWGFVLFLWVVFVARYLSKSVYHVAGSRWSHRVGVYFARKVIHILAGGLVAYVVGAFNVFSSPILPVGCCLLLALVCYDHHRRGNLMWWFQVEENMYEVNFCVMWGLLVALGWVISGGWWLGVVPILFMAWGDGVTGVVRNFLFRRRTKHWTGNVAMFCICGPIGYYFFGWVGVLAAVLACLIEHLEKVGKYLIDDNISVPLLSFVVLLIGVS